MYIEDKTASQPSTIYEYLISIEQSVSSPFCYLKVNLFSIYQFQLTRLQQILNIGTWQILQTSLGQSNHSPTAAEHNFSQIVRQHSNLHHVRRRRRNQTKFNPRRTSILLSQFLIGSNEFLFIDVIIIILSAAAGQFGMPDHVLLKLFHAVVVIGEQASFVPVNRRMMQDNGRLDFPRDSVAVAVLRSFGFVSQRGGFSIQVVEAFADQFGIVRRQKGAMTVASLELQQEFTSSCG